MNEKTVRWVSIGCAAIAMAIAMIVVFVKRADVARSRAEEAASAEATAIEQRREAEANAKAEAEKRRAAEANAKARADELATAKLEKERLAESRKQAEAEAQAKDADAKKARAEADSAESRRAEAAAKAESERLALNQAAEKTAAENAKAKAEADHLAAEKLKADKIIAEAKLLELRKVDFQSLERDLLEWKHDLEERERALQPEKTIADLSWAGGEEDSIIDAEGNVKKVKKVEYRAEDDLTLPKGTRQLAKSERIAREDSMARAKRSRDVVVGELERLYETAVREDRVVDANFYRKSIKSLYPDWEYAAKKADEEK